MSQDILNEIYFFGTSVFMGVFITFVYDFILIGRRVVSHSIFFISVEDFIFWAACAVMVFYMLYEENNGILRWFAVMGAAFGMLIYKKTIGMHFVALISTLIKKEIHIVKRIFWILSAPLRWCTKKTGSFFHLTVRKERKLVKYLKKKLTIFIKMLKITLCKH